MKPDQNSGGIGRPRHEEITGKTEGNAERARGHVNCMEIVRDHASPKRFPSSESLILLAKVTHEAVIGSIDQKQIETLMAHGLTPEQAVETVVAGLLGEILS